MHIESQEAYNRQVRHQSRVSRVMTSVAGSIHYTLVEKKPLPSFLYVKKQIRPR